MHLGIDLGTSNSAVAGFRAGHPAVFKTPEGADVMPSVIHIDRRGNRTVGVRAYDQAIMAPENVAQGFKRLMGTATPLHFAASGQEMLPEQASAELLRTMAGYAMVEAGADRVGGAVVTIPAAFNQMQSEATLQAATDAGLDRVALLQEPVAAALAAMAGSTERSGQFLVYDLGGGTFDLALVQASQGTVNVAAHEGINMLGGRDFDRLILDEVVQPWLARSFKLPEGWQADRRWQRLVRVARLAAERAKIELSTRTEATISASDDLVRLEDQTGEPVYLDVPLTRATLDALVEERVTTSIQLCRKIIADSGYGREDIGRVVLVGGPTKMPVIRTRVQEELGIPVEDVARVDPMTAVALGAAIYAEGRDWAEGGSTAKKRRVSVAAGSDIQVSYDYEQRTAATRAKLRVQRTAGPEGATVQVESMLGWSSGRLSLDKPVELQLDLPDPGPNLFRALVFDPQGRPVADASREMTIERAYAAAAGIPATQTVGMKVLDDQGRNTVETVVPKGSLLPLSGTARFRAADGLRAGDPGMLRLELFQLNDEGVRDPQLNLHVGEFRVRGSDLPEGLAIRRGDEILVHWTMGDSQTLEAEVEIPSVGQSFDTRNFYNWQTALRSFDGEDGGKLASEMLDRAEEDLSEAEAALPGSARGPLPKLRARLKDARALLAGTADPDTRRGVTEEARLIRQGVATACNQPAARGAVLRRRLDEQARFYDRHVRDAGGYEANARADQLVRNGRAEIEQNTPESFDLAERLVNQVNAHYWSEGLKQPGFCAMYWRWGREERHLSRDKALFDRTLERGDKALAADDTATLRQCLFTLWENQVGKGRQHDVAAKAGLLRA